MSLISRPALSTRWRKEFEKRENVRHRCRARGGAAAQFDRRLVICGDRSRHFCLAFVGVFGFDLLGWVTTTSVWVDPTRAFRAISKGYAGLGGAPALGATFLVLLATLSAAVRALGRDVKRFAGTFAVVFISLMRACSSALTPISPLRLQRTCPSSGFPGRSN
jgi:hypothetical protein